MSSYLVLKRMKEDRVHLPGEILVDPPAAAILMERGYLQPVPDNFIPPTTAARRYGPSAHETSTPEQSAASGSGLPPTGGALTLEGLLTLSRADLNDLATEAGVEGPDKLPNKQAVAEAILTKTAADDEASKDGAADADAASTAQAKPDHDDTFDATIGA